MAVPETLEGLELSGFAEWRGYWEHLREGVRSEEVQARLRDLLPVLFAALNRSAAPERAASNFLRWLEAAPDQSGLLARLANDPRALEIAVTLFAGSQFLSVIFLRHPDYLDMLLQREGLAAIKSAAEYATEARGAVAGPEEAGRNQISGGNPVSARDQTSGQDTSAVLDGLRRYQQHEFLRIGLADLCGLLDLSSVTAQLSRLAEGVVRVCLDLAAARTGIDSADFTVLALGKLGGGELNYSSDIDLLFLAGSNTTVYERLGRELIKMLTQVTGEGFLYRVDMRLRPWGRVGTLVPTVSGYQAYLEQHARLWERQSLLKARPIAGNEQLGREILEWAAARPFDGSRETVRADIGAMKQRTEAELDRQGRDWGEVKLGRGSIRDVEFVTQYLQLAYGQAYPAVRSGNTLDALSRLAEAGLLPSDEHRTLVEGYVFLRTVEHYLQMLEYRQTNTLPARPAELAYLAQRLGFEGPDATAVFMARYQQHSNAVRAVYQQYLGAIAMNAPANPVVQPPDEGVRKHVAHMSPSYTATFSPDEIRAHAAMVEQLSEDKPVDVAVVDLGEQTWQATIVGYDYPGELSLICGLLFVHGFSIRDGHVYTYEVPAEPAQAARTLPAAQLPAPSASRGPRAPRSGAGNRDPRSAGTRSKIVDVFTVHKVGSEAPADLWLRYAADLAELLRLLARGQGREAQGELAKRVALALRPVPASTLVLHPIGLEIDNETSDRYTILRISTLDTIGFLYEFTNALALTGVYISEVSVSSAGNRVYDVLHVTDAQGRKITGPEKQRELRATTVLIKHFTHLLPQSPNPQAALLHFHAYLGELLRRPTWTDELASLQRPEVLHALARLLGVSDFLWEDFLRMQYGNLFPVVRDPKELATPKSKERLREDLADELQAAPEPATRRDALNAFKDREMFRADMRYILGHLQEFDQFAAELTDLAEVVIEAACYLADAALRARYGDPCLEDGRPSALAICALGKCGGRELGFASDIELMFVYAGNGMTTGPQKISTSEYYEKLVPAVVQSIRARREGIFEIDLQLRPYGSAGSLAVSLGSFRRYFAPGGAAWPYERQALIKLRPIAGDTLLGRTISTLRDEFVYGGEPFDATAMRAMRERQIRHLVTAGAFNAKFSLGGLVDIEYLVQGLQINGGRSNPRLRSTNTRGALAALAEAGILAPEEYDFLCQAHSFLWRLIEALRVVRGNAKDLTVPAAESEEFAFLARRLGYGNEAGRLAADLTTYTAGTRKLLSRL